MKIDRNLSRRRFLETAGTATLAAMAAGPARQLLADAPIAKKTPATADTVIVLWMAGGMAHTEMFDPKRYTPFEKGLDPTKVLSTFPSIDTTVDSIKFAEGLEQMASVMNRGTLIRSYKAGDLGFILHSRHQYQWHTGYAPPQTVAAPHIGAVIARTLGPLNPAVPAFIDIGQRFDLGEGEELKSFHTAGFLGGEFGPFLIPYPDQAASTIRPPKGMSPSRFENRDKFYKRLVKDSPLGEAGSDYQQQSLLRAMDGAHRLLSSPSAKAFDLSLEPKESYDKYNTGQFGLGCLLARRLTEVGARFIEVTTEYIPFLNWDTHDNGHTRMIEMKKHIDAPVAQLVRDLESRGLLNRTLIVLASEFSRDMMLEGRPGQPVQNQVEVPKVINELKYYGMHRHFTDGASVVMFGGGARRRSSDPKSPWVPEVYGDAVLINGKIFPYLEVEPRKYRFRLLNGANGRAIHLTFNSGQVSWFPKFHQIGSDQGLLPAPVEMTRVRLSPAERADLIFDFSAYSGSNIILRNDNFNAMQFRVAAKGPRDDSVLPQSLRPVPKLAESSAIKTRMLTLVEVDDANKRPLKSLLNNAHWNMPVTENPVLDSVEIWNFVNLTNDDHPIHLHMVRFQILDRRAFSIATYVTTGEVKYLGPPVLPDAVEAGWKDTVRADHGMVTRIIIRFEGFTGRYVWHCHILEHEDNEMMRPFDVVAPPPSRPSS